MTHESCDFLVLTNPSLFGIVEYNTFSKAGILEKKFAKTQKPKYPLFDPTTFDAVLTCVIFTLGTSYLVTHVTLRHRILKLRYLSSVGKLMG